MAYLRDHGVIPPRPAAGKPPEDARLIAYRNWLGRDHGATDATIRRYVQEATRWLPTLGPDPARYTATIIRTIALDQEPARSRTSVHMTVAVLRSFLRFTASTGACPAMLADARVNLAGSQRHLA
jgi:hypothetical protein